MPSTNMSRLLKVGIPATGAALGTLGVPEESEAITPGEFWKGLRPLAESLPKGSKKKMLETIERIPKKVLEPISGAEVKPIKGKQSGQYQFYSNEPSKGKITVDPFKASLNTPFHEVGHSLYYQIPEEQARKFENFSTNYRLSPPFKAGLYPGVAKIVEAGFDITGGRSNLGKQLSRLSGANLQDSFVQGPRPAGAELFAEMFNHYIRKDSKFLSFPEDLQKVMHKIVTSKKGIAALTASGLGSQVLEPEEAEAFPVKPLTKTLGKMLKVSSSAEKDWIGRKIAGKTVTGIKKGEKDWRTVYFEDGTELPLTKDYLNSMLRGAGTSAYKGEFLTQPKSGKQSMAAESLNRRLQRFPMEDVEKYTKEHVAHKERLKEVLDALKVPNKYVEEISKANEQVLVRYPKNDVNARPVLMPKFYADILAEKGIVTIISGGIK